MKKTNKELVIFLGFLLIAVVLVTVSNLCSSVADKSSAPIHAAMANILGEEVPRDVMSVEFNYVGTAQVCSLSDDVHNQSAAVTETPHAVRFRAEFMRKSVPAGGWEGPRNKSFWLAAPSTSGFRTDGDAVSAEDFRQIVRQCIVAIRAKAHRPQQWPLTTQQNRDSWKAVPVQNKIASSSTNSKEMVQ
jgi:hypothetical protein